MVKCSDNYVTVRREGQVFENYTNKILVNLNRALNKEAEPILVFDRWNKSSVKYYYPLIGNTTNDCNGCQVPPFVEAMPPQLFSKIQGVVPSDDGYLILFNITDVLKYCVTGVTEVWHNFHFEFN